MQFLQRSDLQVLFLFLFFSSSDAYSPYPLVEFPLSFLQLILAEVGQANRQNKGLRNIDQQQLPVNQQNLHVERG